MNHLQIVKRGPGTEARTELMARPMSAGSPVRQISERQYERPVRFSALSASVDNTDKVDYSSEDMQAKFEALQNDYHLARREIENKDDTEKVAQYIYLS